MKFVCQSCGREFDIGAPKGMKLPCPACGGMMVDDGSAPDAPDAPAAPPPAPVAAAPAPAPPPPVPGPVEEAAPDEWSLDAAEAFLRSQQAAAQAPEPPPESFAAVQAPSPEAAAYEPAAGDEWAGEAAPQDWEEAAPAQPEPQPFTGGVTAALDAAVSEGEYGEPEEEEEEQEQEEEGASPLVLILGWVLFGVAIVCLAVMAYLLRIYHVQLRDAGDPAKLKADSARLWRQLEDERQSARALATQREEFMAQSDALTVQVTDLKRDLRKANAAAKESADKVAALEGRLEVSERTSSDLKEKMRELEERSRAASAEGTEALGELLAGRRALHAIELLDRPGRWGEALVHLNEAVRSQGDLMEARWLRGMLLVRLRRPKEALQDLMALDELARRRGATGHVRALAAAGDVWRTQLDDRGRAKESYQAAAKAAPKSPYGRLAQARVDVLDGRAEQVRRTLEQDIKAIEAAGEDYAPLCQLLAEILAASPDGRDEAILQATKALVADPSCAPALDLRARLCLERGQLEQATADLLRAKEIDPFDTGRLVTLGGVLVDLKRHGQAEMVLREALTADPASTDARVSLGKALVGLEKHDEAVRLVSEAMKDAPESPGAHLVRGEASLALGRYRDGLRDLERAIQLGRDNARARVLLARTYATATGTGSHDPERALAHARIAVDLTRRLDAEALAALGIAYAAGNDFIKAANEMRQALALEPNSEFYRKLLAEYRRKAQ